MSGIVGGARDDMVRRSSLFFFFFFPPFFFHSTKAEKSVVMITLFFPLFSFFPRATAVLGLRGVAKEEALLIADAKPGRQQRPPLFSFFFFLEACLRNERWSEK